MMINNKLLLKVLQRMRIIISAASFPEPGRTLLFSIILLLLLQTDSCIVDYIPKISDSDEMLVVEALITDQPGMNSISITYAQPLWRRQIISPLRGCVVSISDDLGNTYIAKETAYYGTYVPDPLNFRGVPGRKYTLHIKPPFQTTNINYESLPTEMIPVPSVNKIYYEKKLFTTWPQPVEGCNIYLDTYDPSDKCKFYRWEYSETWEFHLPYNYPNRVCWISNNPRDILIKNSSLTSGGVIRYPLLSITNPVDRLSIKYSLLVNQFSLNEDEYLYWERLKNTIDQVGGLYDLIPANVPNNIFCVEDTAKKVLGYFSVSAISSKRIFIVDSFAGTNGMYYNCVTDTVYTTRPDTIPGIGTQIWVLVTNTNKYPPEILLTRKRSCIDCTTRGTNIRPVFWDSNK
jgi:hypothetical protein